MSQLQALATPTQETATRQLSTQELAQADFIETRSVTLNWRVTGLKVLFESSKGETKSKCVKSALFDSHRWQVFLYPNSGHEQYCSLYLSCEPTPQEKERGLAERARWAATAGPSSNPPPGSKEAFLKGKDGEKEDSSRGAAGGGGARKDDGKGPWKREGCFKFTFEAKSADGRLTYKSMEANDHSFSDSARNWGYANFIKRSDAYFNNPTTRQNDAMLITCTIVYSPTPPTPPPLPRLLIPQNLVSAYASLFDDPEYSDIVFRIRRAGSKARERRLYAAKKVLVGRSEYFETMFESGFYESTAVSQLELPPSPPPGQDGAKRAGASGMGTKFAELEDEDESDYDEDEDDFAEDDDSELAESEYETEDEENERVRTSADPDATNSPTISRKRSTGSVLSSSALSDDAQDEPTSRSHTSAESDGRATPEATSSRAFVDAPASPAKPAQSSAINTPDLPSSSRTDPFRSAIPRDTARSNAKFVSADAAAKSRPRMEVVVTDAAYGSFRSLLYWLYTDSISFAPLASTYHVAREAAQLQGTPFPFADRRAYLLAHSPPLANKAATEQSLPGPCSAKAIYRLADKLGLPELKERAYEHIIKSLTVQNIPYEVFGSFSSNFEEIRKVEIAFLLERWNEVRSGPSMRRVFNYIRTGGRFPGFEEVWVRILDSLEYRPQALPAEEERV